MPPLTRQPTEAVSPWTATAAAVPVIASTLVGVVGFGASPTVHVIARLAPTLPAASI